MKIKKDFLKNIKKTILLIMILSLCLISVNFISFSNVFAIEPQPIFQINGTSGIVGNYFVYRNAEGNIIGKVGVRLNNSDEYLSLEGVTNSITLPTSTVNDIIRVDLIPETGYQVLSSAFINGSPTTLPGAEANGMRSVGIDVTSNNQILILDNVTFQVPGPGEPMGPQGPGGPEGPQGPEIGIDYPVAAYFEGVDEPVISDERGFILLPEGWTAGDVTFFARTCTNNGQLQPYFDGMNCDPNSYEERRLDFFGIANMDQINRTVQTTGTAGNQKAVVSADFQKYGKATMHLTGEEVGTVVSLVTSDLIFVKATSPIDMSYSLGSVDVDNVLLTSINRGRISIFFGNTETMLRAEGKNVRKISKVTGAASVTYSQQEGTATVVFPPLSKETTTTLTLEIEMLDGTKVTKTVDVARTAITLKFNKAGGDATLEAGYVFNKAYLYNNQNHSDAIFDAYLQVILYKDGVVAGYKQVQIDDEELINQLRDNESGAIEIVGDNHINLYGKELNDTIEGVDSASVFLTNGPINYDSDTLPSVEFGIGSGVTVDFGGEQ